MNHVKQTGPGLCMAASVAMLTGETIETVLKNARILKSVETGMQYLPTNEAIIYLAKHMLCFGIVAGPLQFTKETKIVSVGITLEQDALITVPSKNFPGEYHSCVWDSKIQMIRDPLKEEPQSLFDYEIIDWSPVVEIPNVSAVPFV